jgi:O-antigen/teichoic acid export membrane protein
LSVSSAQPDVTGVPGKALRSVVQLVAREAVVKVLALVGGVVVARQLSPSAFGIFAVATFAVGIFAIFSELGMGAAFIRMSREVTPRELNALFTFQVVLVAFLALLIFLAAPWLAAVYGMPELAWVARAMSLYLVLLSLRTVPVIVAERRLDYGSVALSDVSGQVAYWLVAVVGALAGLGVWSLVAAIIVSAALTTGLMFARTATRPSLQFDWRPLRDVFGFGLRFQGQTVSHFAKDTLIPSMGGLLYGGAAVGYLTLAQQIAGIPLILTKLVERVSYSALSRLQDDSAAFSRMLESTLRWTCRLCFPAFAVLAGLAPQLVEYVYGPRWSPILPALYVLTLNMALGVGTGVLMPSLYAGGQAAAGLRISIGWTLITALIALFLWAAGLGFTGIAIAYAAGTLCALVATIVQLHRRCHIDLVDSAGVPALTAAALGVVLYASGPRLVHGVLSLALLGLAGAAGALVINLFPDRVLVVRMIRSHSVGLGAG